MPVRSRGNAAVISLIDEFFTSEVRYDMRHRRWSTLPNLRHTLRVLRAVQTRLRVVRRAVPGRQANGLRGRKPGLILIEQWAELGLWDVKNLKFAAAPTDTVLDCHAALPIA
jgi:hypothetical protein